MEGGEEGFRGGDSGAEEEGKFGKGPREWVFVLALL